MIDSLAGYNFSLLLRWAARGAEDIRSWPAAPIFACSSCVRCNSVLFGVPFARPPRVHLVLLPSAWRYYFLLFLLACVCSETLPDFGRGRESIRPKAGHSMM
jgi:hypothetical protein